MQSDPQGHSQESLRDVCCHGDEITPGEWHELTNSCHVSMYLYEGLCQG